jgi:iron complex outermembrane receptor protein
MCIYRNAVAPVIILLALLSVKSKAQSLSGTITDSASGEPVAGASIYFPKLNRGTVSDVKGRYLIGSLPEGLQTVEVKLLGFKTISKEVQVHGVVVLNIKLPVLAAFAPEVVITSLGNTTSLLRSPVPVTLVSHDALLQQSSNNIIDAIANQPGLNEITEGPGISKPMINGLGYLRVLTLVDGEIQEDLPWGDEHGILIDPYAVYDAEVIRGPASLQYGNYAVAGVVSFKTDPVAEDGTVQGSVLAEYQTNNGMIGNSEEIGGNEKGFVWNLRASIQDAHCYQNPKDGYVWGTAYNQNAVRGMLGIDRKWGFSRLSFSVLHRQVEVPDGNRDSATGQFEFDYPQNGQLFPNRANYLSYDANIAGDQVLDHIMLWWQNRFILRRGILEADFGYSQSQRQEIDTGSQPFYNITLHDIPYSLKYQITGASSGLKLIAGLNGLFEYDVNNINPPSPYIGFPYLPGYNDAEGGGYAILEKDFEKLTVSGGVRYDVRKIDGQAVWLLNAYTRQQQEVAPGTAGAYPQYPAVNNLYEGFSASLGASYQLPHNNYIKLNLAKSYRAPSIQELASNTINAGANAYVVGNPGLQAEQGYESDLIFGNNGKDISFEADGFFNYISHFIFTDRTDSSEQGFPVYQYSSNNAIVTGVAAYFNIHPADTRWIEIDNGFTYIYTFMPNQTDSTQFVPLTPAPRLTSEVKFKLQKANAHRLIANSYLEFGIAKYWAQNNVYSALYTELPSEAYTLFNAGIGTNFVNRNNGRTICSLYINCTNLTNLAYSDHLSHNAYFLAYNRVPVAVTQQGMGIYNMGRSIGFKVVFPIGGKSHN